MSDAVICIQRDNQHMKGRLNDADRKRSREKAQDDQKGNRLHRLREHAHTAQENKLLLRGQHGDEQIRRNGHRHVEDQDDKNPLAGDQLRRCQSGGIDRSDQLVYARANQYAEQCNRQIDDGGNRQNILFCFFIPPCNRLRIISRNCGRQTEVHDRHVGDQRAHQLVQTVFAGSHEMGHQRDGDQSDTDVHQHGGIGQHDAHFPLVNRAFSSAAVSSG